MSERVKALPEDRVLEKYNAYKLSWLHDSIHLIVLIVVLFVVFRFMIGIAVVGGDSMDPHLTDGDLVVYLRLARDYQPGDVVSIRVASGDYYVKRVAATGGDEVMVRDGTVFVNDEPAEDIWAQGKTLRESGAVIYPYRRFRRGEPAPDPGQDLSADRKGRRSISVKAAQWETAASSHIRRDEKPYIKFRLYLLTQPWSTGYETI